jgi:hypothetical protein
MLLTIPKVLIQINQTHPFKMASFNNVSLYIKRAELHCAKDYICNAFSIANIGIVKDVMFIKKVDSTGREYNGAIVIFERWFMNTNVTKLLDDMASSIDGTTKFIYDYRGRHWFINVHKPVISDAKEFATVDASLPDKVRIAELEKLVKTMAAQMHYTQLCQERMERQLMETEEKESHHALCNMELRFKLEDKDMEIDWLRSDNEKALKVVQDECAILKTRLACMAIDLARKDEGDEIM